MDNKVSSKHTLDTMDAKVNMDETAETEVNNKVEKEKQSKNPRKYLSKRLKPNRDYVQCNCDTIKDSGLSDKEKDKLLDAHRRLVSIMVKLMAVNFVLALVLIAVTNKSLHNLSDLYLCLIIMLSPINYLVSKFIAMKVVFSNKELHDLYTALITNTSNIGVENMKRLKKNSIAKKGCKEIILEIICSTILYSVYVGMYTWVLTRQVIVGGQGVLILNNINIFIVYLMAIIPMVYYSLVESKFNKELLAYKFMMYKQKD